MSVVTGGCLPTGNSLPQKTVSTKTVPKMYKLGGHKCPPNFRFKGISPERTARFFRLPVPYSRKPRRIRPASSAGAYDAGSAKISLRSYPVKPPLHNTFWQARPILSNPPVPPYSDMLRFRPERTLLCNSPSPMIAISGKSTIPKRNFAPPNTMIFLFSVYCPAVTDQMGEALIFFRIRNRCHPDGFSLLIQRGDL